METAKPWMVALAAVLFAVALHRQAFGDMMPYFAAAGLCSGAIYLSRSLFEMASELLPGQGAESN